MFQYLPPGNLKSPTMLTSSLASTKPTSNRHWFIKMTWLHFFTRQAQLERAKVLYSPMVTLLPLPSRWQLIRTLAMKATMFSFVSYLCFISLDCQLFLMVRCLEGIPSFLWGGLILMLWWKLSRGMQIYLMLGKFACNLFFFYIYKKVTSLLRKWWNCDKITNNIFWESN